MFSINASFFFYYFYLFFFSLADIRMADSSCSWKWRSPSHSTSPLQQVLQQQNHRLLRPCSSDANRKWSSLRAWHPHWPQSQNYSGEFLKLIFRSRGRLKVSFNILLKHSWQLKKENIKYGSDSFGNSMIIWLLQF